MSFLFDRYRIVTTISNMAIGASFIMVLYILMQEWIW